MADNSLSELASIVHVEIIDGRPAVSTLQVAESFGKDHKNVLRDIEQILSQLPEIFIKLNFEPIEVPVKVGFGTRMDKAYALSRDAFSLIVMGFTGKEALAWKLRYIEAFNAMEAALRAPAPLVLSPFPRLRTLPKARRHELNDLVLAKLAHVPPAFAWKTRKLIQQSTGYDIGERRLFAWLRENAYLHKTASDYNMPTQKSMDLGLFVIQEGSRLGSSGTSHITKTPKVTGKGQIYFINKFKEIGENRRLAAQTPQEVEV